jgi:RNA polymerase sigma factor (sigma-70 family)
LRGENAVVGQRASEDGAGPADGADGDAAGDGQAGRVRLDAGVERGRAFEADRARTVDGARSEGEEQPGRSAGRSLDVDFRPAAERQVSLDEPYNQDARLVRREYGSKDERLTGSVDRIALTRAIRELPAGYRTIFLLHEVEGYEHQEIAELLDCSVGNSKSQLHKAKLRIRELLGRTQQENEAVTSRAQRSRARREAVRWNSEDVVREFPRTVFPVVSQISASNAA